MCLVLHIGGIFDVDTYTQPPYVVVVTHMAQLLGTQLLETAVAATIATGRVQNADNGPLSLLLIAAPESGKTSMVTHDCESTLSFTDITSKGVQDTIKGNPKVSHLIILDMVAIMSHRETTNHLTMSMLNAMTEEGVGAIATPGGTEKFPIGKRGLIACLTHDMASDGRNWWNKTGFATRMLPICFDHSAQLILKIKDCITYGTTIERPKGRAIKLPDEPVTVLLPRKFAEEIRVLADLKSAQFKEKGYRRLKQFKSLAKGHALLQGRRVVTLADIKFTRALMPYISFDSPYQI